MLFSSGWPSSGKVYVRWVLESDSCNHQSSPEPAYLCDQGARGACAEDTTVLWAKAVDSLSATFRNIDWADNHVQAWSK